MPFKGFSLSLLMALLRFFFTLSAVRRTSGLWCQHSVIICDTDQRACVGGGGEGGGGGGGEGV